MKEEESIHKISQEEQADSDEDTLKIDLSRSSIKKNNSLVTMEADVELLETIEGEIGKQLIEKAEKTNLTVSNVKSIIREVLANEHVLALLHKEDRVNFPEPKLTRAKAKELLSSNPLPVPPFWAPQPPPSETQVLVSEELPEDSSGDEEYIPGEDEEHDENDDSMASGSDTCSLPPPTPPSALSMEDNCTQTNWTEDGIFKIPPCRSTPKQENCEVDNIFLRTRSKINMSSTPLEVIENSFIPPDITTDMYDMECDDEEWKAFLKRFTEPLEVAAKPTEDEEHDPEYNILAEYDEIEKVDKIERKEEFRDDKAVTITKKELKELWEELFEYLQNISDDYEKQEEQDSQITEVGDTSILDSSAATIDDAFHTASMCKSENNLLKGNKTKPEIIPPKNILNHIVNTKTTTAEKNIEVVILHEQICILEQQMRQHVQMLTQNFLLMYEHPEFHHYCLQIKEYLLNFKFLAEGKMFSIFRPVNLDAALRLIDYWRELFERNGEEVKECKLHVQRELSRSLQCASAGNYNFIPTFPQLVLKTIARSEVFLYPALLPKIPFKSEQFYSKKGFIESEDRLLAFGLDHFTTFLQSQDGLKTCKNKYGDIQLKILISYIQEYMMPHRDEAKIIRHIRLSKDPRCADNPIKRYFLQKKLPKMVHYIYPLQKILPPCKRTPDELPTQMRNFLFPNMSPPLQIVTTPILVQNFPNTPGQPLYLLSSTPISVQNSFVPIRVQATSSPIPPNINETPVKLLVPRTTLRKVRQRKSFQTKLKEYGENLKKCNTSIENFVTIFIKPISLRKLIHFCLETETLQILTYKESIPVINNDCNCTKFINQSTKLNINMMPSMPMLNTPGKQSPEATLQDNNISSATSSNTPICYDNLIIVEQEQTKQEIVVKKKASQDFSFISSSNFQQANVSTEVEFCKTTNNFQISQVASQQDKDIHIGSTLTSPMYEKNNLEDNTMSTGSLSAKQTIKKEKGTQLSGADKKKAKIKREFLANLSIATTDDPDGIKHKEEMFAFAFYDKIRETLDLENYHKIMQILNDFESGDAVDLYRKIEPLLKPKYIDILEEFLVFLREKEATELGLLIPWIKVNNRAKFLRKVELYFKDQLPQLKKVYNTLTELGEIKYVSLEKIKSSMLPLLKGNAILTDLFLQNLMCERPPASLLEGPYETIDINKELIRPENEEIYETIVVPNTEDKYGGQNCICHCHTIEDSLYKSRFKHCTSCGLRFVNGQIFVQSGRSMQPATVSFKTSPRANHSVRLLGKPSTSTQIQKGQKRKSDTSPSKQNIAVSKENLDDDTEDEEKNKRKSKSALKPRKRKKPTENDASTHKKSPVERNDVISVKDPKSRKRSKSFKQNKKKDKKIIAQPEEVKGKVTKEGKNDVKKADKKKKSDSNERKPKKKINMEGEQKKVVEEVSKPVFIVNPDGPKFSFEGILNQSTNKFTNTYGSSNSSNFSETIVGDNIQPGSSRKSTHVDFNVELSKATEITSNDLNGSGESIEKPLTPRQPTATESESESQDVAYESDSTSSSTASNTQQSDSNTNDEPSWKREEDTVILETFQQEDDKDYALQIICDKLPNRTISQIRSRFSTLMAILIQTLKDGKT